MRIELTQKYWSEDDIKYWENMGLEAPASVYKYRRIYPEFATALYPMEIPDDAAHCEVLFRDDSVLTVLGTFDELKKIFDERDEAFVKAMD